MFRVLTDCGVLPRPSIRSAAPSILACCLIATAPQTQGAAPDRAAAMQAAIAAAESQPTPRMADGRPDLSGFWQRPGAGAGAFGTADLIVSEGGKRLTLALPPVTVGNQMDIQNAAKRAAATDLRPTYKAEYAAKAKFNFERGDLEDPTYGCVNQGVPRMGAPAEIVQTGTAVYLLYATQNRYRIIPTDGRKHDPNKETLSMGDSVGTWEGDTLVIDTRNISEDTWLDKDGSYHSKDMRVVERFTRKGNALSIDVTVHDPIFEKAFQPKPGQGSPSGTLVLGAPGTHVQEDYPCIERSREHMLSGEKH
jgi:hypothetical protein